MLIHNVLWWFDVVLYYIKYIFIYLFISQFYGRAHNAKAFLKCAPLAWEIWFEWFGSTRHPDGLEPETAQWSPRTAKQQNLKKLVKFLKNFQRIFRKSIFSYEVCIKVLFPIKLFKIFRGIFWVFHKNFTFLWRSGNELLTWALVPETRILRKKLKWQEEI